MRAKIGCVYILRCKDTQECYIGKAENFTNRWSDHLKLLAEKRHHSPYLQESYNFYGKSGFDFDILEVVIMRGLEDRKKLADAERRWIVLLQPALNCQGVKSMECVREKKAAI